MTTPTPTPPIAAVPAQPDALRHALESLMNEAQKVADDYHKPRYARLDEAIASARAVLHAQVAALTAAQPVVFDEQGFRAWVLKNLPDDTIIGNSAWWASHLTQWAQRFVRITPPASQGAAERAVPAGVTFEAWAKAEGGDFALHNCGPYNREAMTLAGMAWRASHAQAPAGAKTDAVMKLVDELVRATTSKNSTHAQYMGKAMPDDVYERFATLRDEFIPELRDKLRAMVTPTAQAAPAAGAVAGPEIEFDGYKGHHNVRWYINELKRIMVVNQWLADIYCNKLRDFFTSEYCQHSRDERDAERMAGNAIADLARGVTKSLDSYWLPGADIPDLAQFERTHDAVTKRLLSGLAAPTPAAQADSEAFQNFHRVLCARFGYVHDERDWRRDQLSLIEHIARQFQAADSGVQEDAARWRRLVNASEMAFPVAAIANDPENDATKVYGRKRLESFIDSLDEVPDSYAALAAKGA